MTAITLDRPLTEADRSDLFLRVSRSISPKIHIGHSGQKMLVSYGTNRRAAPAALSAKVATTASFPLREDNAWGADEDLRVRAVFALQDRKINGNVIEEVRSKLAGMTGSDLRKTLVQLCRLLRSLDMNDGSQQVCACMRLLELVRRG